MSSAEKYVPKEGDKVRVVRNFDKRFKSYVGKEGKVVGAITPHSCRVKLFYDEELTFSIIELQLVEEGEKDAATTGRSKRRTAKRTH